MMGRTAAGLALAVVTAALSAHADAAAGDVALTWARGSTVRIEQLIGDCDYAVQAKTGQCEPTTSQTVTRARVLGTDIGASFESQGRLVFLFGDTLEPAGAENYFAADTIAYSTSTDPETGLFIEFLTNSDGTPYFVRIPTVRMGAAEVPHAGIRLDSGTYVVCNTGADRDLPNPRANEVSVLTRFDEAARRFTKLRTISSMPNGKFVLTSLQPFGSDVLIFGLGEYRASNVYLATVPASTFATGQGTRYFTGLANGTPQWSTSETDAVPIVIDKPAPSIGDVSVTYAENPGLWLMTYDGGRASQSTSGIYFSYAANPWGPWSEPQLIFNASRDGATGSFIHDPRIVPSDGLNGPTIGQNDPATTPGGMYAPFMIDRFTKVNGNKLSIYYLVSTWNPYTIVVMRSDFSIRTGPPRRRTVRH